MANHGKKCTGMYRNALKIDPMNLGGGCQKIKSAQNGLYHALVFEFLSSDIFFVVKSLTNAMRKLPMM